MSNMKFLRISLIVALTLVLFGEVDAADFYWETAVDTTNSWFNLNNWNTGSLPGPTDTALLDKGVCYINSSSNVVVNKLANFQYWQGGTDFTLDVEQGAELSVSNYCHVGNAFVDATINVRGKMNVVNANNNGFALSGYRAGLTNSTGRINIDGGIFEYGAGSGTSSMILGGASTGIVEVANGGLFISHPSLQVGSGVDVQSHGTVIMQEGIWTNFGGVTLANGSAGTGNVIINGGRFESMSTGDACITIGRAGVGYMEVNGGEFVGRHAFNDEASNANRSLLRVGLTSGATGKFVQNGGVVEAVGVSLGASGGIGDAIISNGLFKAMSNNGSWPAYTIYDGCTLTIAGGEFNCYTNGVSGWVRDGGTLEFKSGKFATDYSGTTLFTASNATIRVVGPECDIDVGWWRHSSGFPQYATMEMILTQDAGHLSTLKSPRTDQPTALPGTMDVGFAGGACLLSTNQLTCMYAGNYFYTTYVDPANYGLDLWDIGKSDVATGGDNLNLTLKDSAALGSLSTLSSTYASFAPTAYGYVNFEGIDLGTLTELTVNMTMSAGEKTLNQILKDLQSAGYTNSELIDATTISMKIPASRLTTSDGFFCWDFREFDGTVNATVSAVAIEEFVGWKNQLPNPDAFLKPVGSARQDPIFTVTDFSYTGTNGVERYEQPSFVVGNKAVFVRKIDGKNRADEDKRVTIYIDNKQVGQFMWYGSFRDGDGWNSGYPFEDIEGDPPSLEIDKFAQTVVYSKPYLTPEGNRAVFTYTIKSLTDSKIELSWDNGVTQAEHDASSESFATKLWYSTTDYRGKDITIGSTLFQESERDDLVSAGTSGIRTNVSGDLVYNVQEPLKGYTLELDNLSGHITESIYIPTYADDRYTITYRTTTPTPEVSGKIIIDLGEADLLQEDTPPEVGGIDFWNLDGIHVPTSPTVNVMPNPSFEQGIRYWTWIWGGATYVPAELDRYEVVEQGLFGKNALIIRNTQSGGPAIQSFPISLEDEEQYTLSFYAKASKSYVMKFALMSAASGGKFQGIGGPWGDTWNSNSWFTVTTEWQRYSRTFTADSAGLCLNIFAGNDTLIDGIQIEKGDTATEFVCAPVDGMFTTSDKDNSVISGTAVDAGFTFIGEPGTTGSVTVSAKNIFREIVYSRTFDIDIGGDGTQAISMLFDEQNIGEGVFVIKTDYSVGELSYSEYYRLIILQPLSNTHATKNIFGTLGHYDRITRGEDLAERYMQWGFGSSSWGYSAGNEKLRPYLQEKYRIADYLTVLISQDTDIASEYREWTSISTGMVERIEEVAYESALLRDPDIYNTWAFGNEEEGSTLVSSGQFDEYFKAQYATAQGVLSAMPSAKILPTCGTSGYSPLRGYDAIEGYLKTAQDNDFKYDAIAVHPYGNIDKGSLSQYDLDVETARLIAQMKKYGYGEETPIYYTELFNITETYIPAWGAGGSYDSYSVGKPTYDFGNREFIHASSVARAHIIMLKYWPQVESSNIWVVRPFMDMQLAPLALCKAVNTLGLHLGDVTYQSDIRPTADIRGYLFELDDGTGIAPVWCVDEDVENGLTNGPVLNVTFDQPVVLVDLMGNERSIDADTNGVTSIQLTPAPLLIKAQDLSKLSEALENATTDDDSSPVTVTCYPSLSGDVIISAENLTGLVQQGSLIINGDDLQYNVNYNINSLEIWTDSISDYYRDNQYGKMYKWENDIQVVPVEGTSTETEWKMDYFYVPKTVGTPNWGKIKSIPISNYYGSLAGLNIVDQESDLKADFKMAWNEDNLYLHVEVEDDNVLLFPDLWQQDNAEESLYLHDGCLELYLDTAADGRVNDAKTYDNDDYCYNFSIGQNGTSGAGMVYRLLEVYHQLADGVNMASKEEAVANIKCDFQLTDKGYTYDISIGQRYLEPIVLRKGFIAGFGLFLHDRDDSELAFGEKGLSLATEEGEHCDYNPQLWPLMILSDYSNGMVLQIANSE